MTIPQLMLELGVNDATASAAEVLARASAKRSEVFDRICERLSITPKGLANRSGDDLAQLISESGYPKPPPTVAKQSATEYASCHN